MRRAVVIAVLAAACSRDRSARATADYFVDKYYIEIDHAAALEVADGPVADRIKSERVLVVAAQRQGVGSTQVLPRVYYSVKSDQPIGETRRLVYALSVDSGGHRFRKEVTLLVAHRDGGYRVTGWSEAEVAGVR